MDATHVFCARCAAVRPVRFARLVRTEESLGTKAQCAHCGYFVFTILNPANIYCDVCDRIQPAVLEDTYPAGKLCGGLVRCTVCYATRARLYGSALAPADKARQANNTG